MKARIITRLKPGAVIYDDTKACEDTICDDKFIWSHVNGVPRLGGWHDEIGITKGWVVRRFTVSIDCESLEPRTTADK
jgi:hypothetical protein